MKSKDINYIDKTMRGTCCEAMKLAQVDLMLKLHLAREVGTGGIYSSVKKKRWQPRSAYIGKLVNANMYEIIVG